jgi:hypothetical protein
MCCKLGAAHPGLCLLLFVRLGPEIYARVQFGCVRPIRLNDDTVVDFAFICLSLSGCPLAQTGPRTHAVSRLRAPSPSFSNEFTRAHTHTYTPTRQSSGARGCSERD